MDNLTVIEKPVPLLAEQQHMQVEKTLEEQPVIKPEITPKKKKSVKPVVQKVVKAKTTDTTSTAGLGGDVDNTRQGSSHAGNAINGANTSNSNKVTALSRRIHYPQRATALKIEDRVKIKFDITDKGG